MAVPTTLEEEAKRATSTAFRAAVKAALFRMVPDVIGESEGTAGGPVRLAKRHTLAISIRDNADVWTDRAAWMLAGENTIRNVDASGMPPDNVITGRLTAIFNDLAGVLASDN
jgi:hypothetical protein